MDDESEAEGGAPVQFRLSPNSASVFLNDARYRGQADPGAFEIFGAMQALENSEQLILVFHVESDAVVANGDDEMFILPPVAFFCRSSSLPTIDMVARFIYSASRRVL